MGVLYAKVGANWEPVLSGALDLASADARYVNVAGDTMTGQLILPGNPTDPLGAAPKQYVDAATGGTVTWSAGDIKAIAYAAAGAGWLMCDGGAVSRTTYAALFAAIGTAYGTGDGSTTFNLPDLRGRAGVMMDATVAVFNALGLTGGSRDSVVVSHSHTGPSHTHGMNAHTHNAANLVSATDGAHGHDNLSGAGGVLRDIPYQTASGSAINMVRSGGSAGVITVNTSGSAHSHNVTGTTGAASPANTEAGGTGATGTTGVAATNTNLQPFLVLNYVIKT